jgi:hypothetical protein
MRRPAKPKPDLGTVSGIVRRAQTKVGHRQRHCGEWGLSPVILPALERQAQISRPIHNHSYEPKLETNPIPTTRPEHTWLDKGGISRINTYCEAHAS